MLHFFLVFQTIYESFVTGTKISIRLHVLGLCGSALGEGAAYDNSAINSIRDEKDLISS
jgi:hypothetical protein